MMEEVMRLMEFRVVSIRANHNQAQRETAIKRFNDPVHPAEVLVTSLQLAFQGINLHEACSDMILVESPSALNTIFQAMSRISRIGQRFPQSVWILTMGSSYDEYLEARAAGKYYAQLLAESGMNKFAPGAAGKVLYYELLRRRLGQPFMRFGMDCVDASSQAAARAFAVALTDKTLVLARSAEERDNFNAEYLTAMALRRSVKRIARSEVQLANSEAEPKWKVKGPVPAVGPRREAPLNVADFRLLSGDGFQQYDVPAGVDEGSVAAFCVRIMDAYVKSRSTVDSDDDGLADEVRGMSIEPSAKRGRSEEEEQPADKRPRM
jgi:hypothetical protein